MKQRLLHFLVIPLMVFSLLYTPCVAAIASVKRELGGKWALGMVLCFLVNLIS